MAPTGGGAGRVALWLATQFDRMLDFCLEHCKCCESMMLYMGAPLVVFGVLLIVSVIKIGMYDVLPLVVTPYSFVHWVHIMWAMLLSVNVLWNYYMGVFTDPGSQYSDHYKRLCKEAREMGLLQEEQDQRQQQQQQQQQQQGGGRRRRRQHSSSHQEHHSYWNNRPLMPWDWTKCSKTGLAKAPRSHFDKVTKRLVLQMDHYCPWLFNTVGWANYRYYLMFQFHLVTSTLYIIIMTARPFWIVVHSPSTYKSKGGGGGGEEQPMWDLGYNNYDVTAVATETVHLLTKNHDHNTTTQSSSIGWFTPSSISPSWLSFFSSPSSPSPTTLLVGKTQKDAIVFLFVISVAVTIVLGGFAAHNTYLVITAQTTIEVEINKHLRKRAKAQGKLFVNPFDQGSYWKNWCQLMGSRSLQWHFIPSNHFPPWPPVQLSRSTMNNAWQERMLMMQQRRQCSIEGEEKDKTSRHHRIIINGTNGSDDAGAVAFSSSARRNTRCPAAAATTTTTTTHLESVGESATGGSHADWVLELMRREKSNILVGSSCNNDSKS